MIVYGFKIGPGRTLVLSNSFKLVEGLVAGEVSKLLIVK